MVAVPLPTATPVPPQSLESYARRNAGGPGAIYVGDLSQLVGPAPIQDLGDDSGNVPLDALERHGWIYESDYYRELLDKAEITGSTPLTSGGRQIYIDFVCVDSALPACKLIESYFVPNVLERTNGLVRFQVRSLPELGVAGSDTLNLVSTGTLSGATIFGRYAAGDIPAIDVQSLWGVYSFREESYQAATSMVGDLDRLIEEWTDGGVIFSHSWYSGNDQYLFCRDSRESSRGFRGKKTRSHSASLSDWINGMGAEAQFVAFAEVYTAMERGILDCGMTWPLAAYSQRWYEVTDYLIGPLYDSQAPQNVISLDTWDRIPQDLQQIILEEGAKLELEALRLASIHNEVGFAQLQDAGMEHIPFSAEMQRMSRQAAIGNVIPGWVDRVGDTSDPIITDTFNKKVGPIVGMRINPDGTVTDLR